MLERPADTLRQYIDEVSTFEAYDEALTEAAKVRGGMYWHKGPASAPDEAYLVRRCEVASPLHLVRLVNVAPAFN